MKLTKKFNYLINILGPVILFPIVVSGQSLSIQECYQKAEDLSPIKANKIYLSTIRSLQEENAKSLWMPGVSIDGSASYQSEVITLPFSLPGAEVPEIPKDQYNFSLNLSQRLYDGGYARNQRLLAAASNDVSQAENQVTLYQIREVIEELFFAILLQQENLKVVQLYVKELDNQNQKAEVSFENGILLQSTLHQIKKERLITLQKQSDLLIRIESLKTVLEDWIGEPINSLEYPQISNEINQINRPEIQLFQVQRDLLLTQSELIQSRTLPQVSAFARAGLGQPNPLNFFETEFDSYYLVGARLQWQFWDWGNNKRETQILESQSLIISRQEEQFNRRINNEVIKQQGEIERLQLIVDTDLELLDLQNEIVDESRQQVDLGTLSQSDFLTTLTEQQQLELSANIHRIELEKAKVRLNNITGMP